jgi:DNA-binding beta-propeller fold protein YncE
MAFGKDDTIYVTNDDKIRKIDKSGTVTTIYREESPNKNQESHEPFSRLFGLTVDEQNNVYTADFYNNRLLKISPDGKVSPVLNSEKDWSPIGVAVSDNEIYVLEARPYSAATHTGSRVVKIASDGKPTVIAGMEEAVKPKDAPNKDTDSSLSQTGNAYLSSESSTQNNWLILLCVIGAVGTAFAAFVMLVKRK